MGIRNYLIDGGSGTGKTTVAEELEQRGYNVFHGDRVLAYRGDPKTGEPLETPEFDNEADKALWEQRHWIWDLNKVKSAIADDSHPITFFCGGSRNFEHFVDLLDDVFILEVSDINTIFERMDERVARDPTDFGGKPEEKELVAQIHQTKEGIPKTGIRIDSTAPLDQVVDEIISKCILPGQQPKPAGHQIK